jgi:prophage maintenance system killer protein
MMHYLSVHDLVWINNTVAGRTLAFNYETLEAAMAAQYGYGDSTNVPVQAANLLSTLALDKPFELGNRRTAFIATAAFLNANGYALKVDDATADGIIRDVASGSLTGIQAIEALAEPAQIGLRPGATLRALVTHLFNEHAAALKHLAEGDE